MSNSNSTLLKLAQDIQKTTTDIMEYLSSQRIAEPDFSATSSTVPETYEYLGLRDALNDKAWDLLHLVNGPRNDARETICNMHDLGAWQVALEFKFFEAVPENGSADIEKISEHVGMDTDRARRIFRLLASQRVFEEVEENKFQHTGRSVLYLRDQHFRDACHYQLDEFLKAVPHISASIREAPFASDSSQCAFKKSHGVELWNYYKANPHLAGRFASAMVGVGKLERHFENLRDGYPWNTLTEGRLVDMGGGNGHMAISLARTFPNLSVLVQDANQDMLSQASKFDLTDLNERIEFMQHSFFETQPVSSAAAYLLRQSTHNWNDESCIRIFKALVPALERSKKGTPLLINDIVLPEPLSVPRFQEHRIRQVDMMMMGMLGAKQRTEAEFISLLREADARLKIQRIHGKADACLIEVHLDKE